MFESMWHVLTAVTIRCIYMYRSYW